MFIALHTADQGLVRVIMKPGLGLKN